MSDHAHYCPFLNRSDARCSKNFSLDRLSNTYDYCFGSYAACAVYRELLVERRQRRAQAAQAPRQFAFAGPWAISDRSQNTNDFVELTHAGRRISAA